MTVLVTGGTGKTGRRVVERLRARGVDARVGSRSGEPRFDWEDPGTWPAALTGADAAYIAYHPDLAVPGAAGVVRGFAQRAAAAGVTRLTLLSGRGEEEALAAEREVRAVFPDVAVVRCAFFAQNFSESFLADAVAAGEVALPVDGVPEPFVDAEDIADVAVATLVEDGHAGRLYELTGPRMLTFAQATAAVAEASGRPVTYTTVPADAWVAGLAGQGLPDELVALLRYLFTEVMDGRNARTADGVREALGRPPRDFADFARDAAARGTWG